MELFHAARQWAERPDDERFSSIRDMFAKTYRFGEDRPHAVEGAHLMVPELPQNMAEAAYDEADQHPEDGDPRSAWGLSAGLSRISQERRFGDERTRIDRLAGAVLDVAFKRMA